MNNGPTISVVDDDAGIRDLIFDLLNPCGHTVLTYPSAERLLRSVGAESVGCVITDLQLPGMDGRELLQRLSRIAPAMAVIIITGKADVPTTVELMRQGAVSVFEKPFDGADIIASATTALDVSREIAASLKRVGDLRRRLCELSEQERMIAQGMIVGTPIKAMARHLQISMRTVDRRRQAVFDKMRVNSIGELASVFAEASIDRAAARLPAVPPLSRDGSQQQPA